MIYNPNLTHPSRCEIQQCWGAKTPRTDNENGRLQQTRLPLFADIWKDEMPSVALSLSFIKSIRHGLSRVCSVQVCFGQTD